MDSADVNYFVTSFVSLGTMYAFYRIFSIQNKINKNNKLIKEIQTSNVLSPGDVNQSHKQKKILVRGTVKKNTSDPENRLIEYTTDAQKKQEFILHLRFREPMFSNDGFSEAYKKGIINLHHNFLLTSQNNQKSLLVNKYDINYSYENVLEITNWIQNKRKLTFTEKAQTLIYSYFRALGTLAFRDKRSQLINGLNVGERHVECGVKVGSSLLALGTVGLTVDGQLFIEPQVLLRDRLTFITQLQDVIQKCEEARTFWAILSIIGAIYLGRRAFHFNNKHNIIEKLRQKLNI